MANRVRDYTDNDYFKGVISAITTQGEVTVNVRGDQGELATRRNNMSKPTLRAKSYFGGDVTDHHQIKPHELVFGWVNKQGRNPIPGNPSQVGFVSLNGLCWGNASTDEELESRIRFIGLAKTPFNFEDKSQLQHGFAAIAVGTGTTVNTGALDIFPGDKLVWRVWPRPEPGSDRIAGGQFGDGGPGTRQGYPSRGTPRGKLRFLVEPSRFNDMRPSLNHAVSCMLKPMAQGGVADRPFEHLFNSESLGPYAAKPRPAEEYAMATLLDHAVSSLRAIKVLQGHKEINLQTIDEVSLAEKIGIFKTDPEGRTILNELISAWWLDISANRVKSRAALTAFKRDHAAIWDNTQTRVKRLPTTQSRYAQVAVNLGNYGSVAYARAVHSVARRRFAVSLSFSRKGQRLDVLLGHFLESF